MIEEKTADSIAKPHLAGTGLIAEREAEEVAGLWVSLDLVLGEAGGMSLDRLGNLPVDAVQLHRANDTVLLKQTTTDQEPRGLTQRSNEGPSSNLPSRRFRARAGTCSPHRRDS
jgi:hypothetical protein